MIKRRDGAYAQMVKKQELQEEDETEESDNDSENIVEDVLANMFDRYSHKSET